MPDTLIYPTSATLKVVEQTLLPRLTMDRRGFKLFPIAEGREYQLIWEQKDRYRGLQQVRGLNGQPRSVRPIGGKRFQMEPGVYGEFMEIDEMEMTTRRAMGTLSGAPIDISDLVAERQEQLLLRRIDRLESIIWTLATTGTFLVANESGGTLHQGTFDLLTSTAIVPWTAYETATPLQDFRVIQLLSRGQSTSFGADAVAVMNQVTFNHMVRNRNPNDLAGRRVGGLLTPLTFNEINGILLGEGLPRIEIYDQGYINESDVFVPYIADGVVSVEGKRASGTTIGEYRMTLNANNANGAPGAYTKVIDTIDREVPRRVEVHDGHNGGPVVYFPGSLLRMNVI